MAEQPIDERERILIEDTRPFVDWLVKESGEWRLRAAVELPGPDER